MTITAGRSDNRERKTHGEKQEKKEERRWERGTELEERKTKIVRRRDR